MKKHTAIILAGGYGVIQAGPARICKLAAHLNGRPLIYHVLENLFAAGLFDGFVVVINETYGPLIQKILAPFPVTYVTQPGGQAGRVGSGGAVLLALEVLPAEVDTVFIYFADMPLWHPDTLHMLAQRHLAPDRPKLTMVTMPLVPGTNPAKYGRILRDSSGRIVKTLDDHKTVNGMKFAAVDQVNPSLYVADVEWLRQALPQVELYQPPDNWPPERCLQGVICVAVTQNLTIGEVNHHRLEEALGVNNRKELREVRMAYRRLYKAPETPMAGVP